MAYGQCRCMFMARVHVERLSTSTVWPLPDDLLVWSAGRSSPLAMANSLSFSSVLNSVSSSWSSSTCLWQMVVNSHGLAQKLSSQRCVSVRCNWSPLTAEAHRVRSAGFVCAGRVFVRVGACSSPGGACRVFYGRFWSFACRCSTISIRCP